MVSDPSDLSAVLEAISVNGKSRISCMLRQNPDMSVLRLDDTIYTNCNLSSRVLNIAMGGDFSHSGSTDKAREIKRYYAKQNIDFALWLGPLSETLEVTDINLKAAGYEKTEEVLVGMVAPLTETVSPNSPFSPPIGLEIARVITAGQLHDFGEVINTAFPPPPYDGYIDFAKYNADMAEYIDFNSFPYRMFVGYIDGVPVATSAVLLDAGVAGVYDVCTKPNFQRQGYATLMMRKLLDEARKEGYKVTTLLASKDGQGIYSRLGYHAIGEWYIWNNA